METAPTLQEKEQAERDFRFFYEANRKQHVMPQWSKYGVGFSHDGITLWNDSSNNFGYLEILLIQKFCDEKGYTFSFCSRKTTSLHLYGGVMVEINIWQE